MSHFQAYGTIGKTKDLLGKSLAELGIPGEA